MRPSIESLIKVFGFEKCLCRSVSIGYDSFELWAVFELDGMDYEITITRAGKIEK